MTRQALEWSNPVAVIFVDLDHFKAMNDRWTNAKVDQTILPDAQRLVARLVQGRGEAYRHGGEEFLLIMPNLDTSEAQAFGEKVRSAVEGHRFEVDSEVVRVTVSVGVALWPVHGDTFQEVLEASNRAELEAKSRRNSVAVATAAS
jgi:two-component system, cell cycle response regulator